MGRCVIGREGRGDFNRRERGGRIYIQREWGGTTRMYRGMGTRDQSLPLLYHVIATSDLTGYHH